ncbi:MAG: VanW family protein [Bacteroidales bacterium]
MSKKNIPDTLLKPKQRSKLRLYFGKQYYTISRKLYWLRNYFTFAKAQTKTPLPHTVFEHKTPLYRELKKVDMWMQENKVSNLNKATHYIDGILIKPGEIFSYWFLIGKPTKRKGYKPGMVLDHGTFTSGIGGGLCQLSNLLFWMFLHSPLTVTERYRHSYDVFPDVQRKIPFGSGATCVYNYRDLMVKNNTANTFQINLSVSEKNLHGKIRSLKPESKQYKIYEKEHIIHHHSWGGYSRHNIIYRKTYENETGITDEYMFENHALMMYQPYIDEKQ